MIASAAVVDAEGRVVASTQEGPWAPRQGDVEVALPQGGKLVLRAPDAEGWEAMARAFVHEVRSPLNALAIYLDLVASKAAQAPESDKVDSPVPRLLEKSAAQVRRVEELLKAFTQAWVPNDDGATDLAAVAAAVARFADHEARRRSATLEFVGWEPLLVDVAANVVAEALVRGVLGAMAERGRVRLEVGRAEGGGARLRIEAQPEPSAAAWAAMERVLEGSGARVETGTGFLRATFEAAREGQAP